MKLLPNFTRHHLITHTNWSKLLPMPALESTTCSTTKLPLGHPKAFGNLDGKAEDNSNLSKTLPVSCQIFVPKKKSQNRKFPEYPHPSLGKTPRKHNNKKEVRVSLILNFCSIFRTAMNDRYIPVQTLTFAAL